MNLTPFPVTRQIDAEHRKARVELLLLTIAACAIGVWAAMPLVAPAPVDTITDSKTATATSEPRLADRSLPQSAFDASLVRLPPKPVAPEPPPPPPPPPRLVLLAIAGQPGQPNTASIYDPDLDTVLQLQSGQSHGAFTVTRVTSDLVELRHGQRAITLMLDPARPPGAPR
jgi:hypothetical protein